MRRDRKPKPSKPPTLYPDHVLYPDHDDPKAWEFKVEAQDGYFWRYSVALHCGVMIYGPDGGHWYRFSCQAAIRKGQRELAKMRRKLERKAARRRALGVADHG